MIGLYYRHMSDLIDFLLKSIEATEAHSFADDLTDALNAEEPNDDHDSR